MHQAELAVERIGACAVLGCFVGVGGVALAEEDRRPIGVGVRQRHPPMSARVDLDGVQEVATGLL